MIADDAWVPLAEIARPHGVRGEMRLNLFNKDSDLLLELDEVLLRTRDGEEHEVSVDGARRANDAILLKLYSVDDRDAAAELRGALVCARRGSFPKAREGEFYWCDILGASVVVEAEGGDGTLVGAVRELKSYPTVDVLVVRAKDGGADWEVPLTSSFVRAVDAPAGVVTLVTMEGLERG